MKFSASTNENDDFSSQFCILNNFIFTQLRQEKIILNKHVILTKLQMIFVLNIYLMIKLNKLYHMLSYVIKL